MWLGYTNYPDTFLAADDKLRLNQSSFLDPLDLTTTLPSCVATLAGALISATKTVSGDFTEAAQSLMPSR